MPNFLRSPGAPSASHTSLLRDLVVVGAVTLGAALLAAHLEFNEILFSATRRWEYLQLDEWPVALLVLALCLIWLYGRRYRQARAELHARQAAEASLATALRENRALGHQHLRALEAERKHLARELHDELGQYLNAIKLDAAGIRDESAQNGTSYDAPASRILKAVDHVHAVVSDMIRRLRPAGLDELGLVAAVESCVDQWRQRSPDTSFSLTVTGNFEDLDETASLTVYRLVQECLTNSFRHAGAGRIEVELRSGASADAPGDAIVMTVRDDGRGIDPRAHRPGFGLGSMRERVTMLGGRFEIRSTPGNGCTVEARIPRSGDADGGE
jgi:two-component system, NarL family, sensor histidine kinase UhpB